ncbi:MAG: L-threonylcarbamoyladenylate synthase [Patescibacteria group bacterium]|nr:L-threonylcarbamoyladenylate synthase [Patescibacteria group bacterium]
MKKSKSMAIILKINFEKPEREKIGKVVEVLKAGGIIVYPTDTIYGLGCDIFKKQAVEKIYQLKGRARKKPLSIIFADIKEVAKYCIIQDYAYRLMNKVLPGPYTFILKARNAMPKTFLPKNRTVGVRIPNNQICLEIVKALGNPIITTSLNISGEDVMSDPKQLSKEMSNKIEIIIDNGPLALEPSSVIDLSGDKPEVLRRGLGELNLFQY